MHISVSEYNTDSSQWPKLLDPDIYMLHLFPLFTESDEELPDYIMVMVANKKTSQQMADDLSLFLGNNTTKFTEWYDDNLTLLFVLLHMKEVCSLYF